MLVIARHEDESLILTLPDGDEIEIRICEVKGKRVRVGVTAPKSVRVDRREVAYVRTPRPVAN